MRLEVLNSGSNVTHGLVRAHKQLLNERRLLLRLVLDKLVLAPLANLAKEEKNSGVTADFNARMASAAAVLGKIWEAFGLGFAGCKR